MVVSWREPLEDSDGLYAYSVTAADTRGTYSLYTCSPPELSQLTCRLTGLQPGTQYAVSVSACAKNKRCSVPSRPVTGSTSQSAPSDLAVRAATSTSITLTWDHPLGDRGGSFSYIRTSSIGMERVSRCTTPQGNQSIACTIYNLQPYSVYNLTVKSVSICTVAIDATDRMCVVNDLQPHSLYEVSVIAYASDNFRSHPSAPEYFSTPPWSPEAVKISDVTSSTIKVSWKKPKNDSSYQLKFTVMAVPQSTVFGEVQLCTTQVYNAEMSCTVKKLQANSVYNILVKACTDADVCSPPTLPLPARTLPSGMLPPLHLLIFACLSLTARKTSRLRKLDLSGTSGKESY
ncbi:unnamed protein product [Schistocephalus solidus]|uniref:Fibronectin type III domain n=1 Tax=Schistocephalus solidus TaxID=70667 RepID=A0A183SA34_SCHSO|nr:unnamed protein product [Schistocephalus solidus]